MQKPFKKNESKFRKLRFWTNKDYERIGVKNYKEDILNAIK